MMHKELPNIRIALHNGSDAIQPVLNYRIDSQFSIRTLFLEKDQNEILHEKRPKKAVPLNHDNVNSKDETGLQFAEIVSVTDYQGSESTTTGLADLAQPPRVIKQVCVPLLLSLLALIWRQPPKGVCDNLTSERRTVVANLACY